MRTFARSPKTARLNCEALEDRLTPVAAFSLSATGLGTANLLGYDTNSPAVATTTPITNIATNETLVGIDFRPQNGQLYGLGVNATGTGTLYNISTRTGRASPIGATGSVDPTTVAGGVALPNPATATNGFGFDFNPVVDKVRIISTNGQSFVIDQNTGLVVANNGSINGATSTGTGTSYTNNQQNATATTQYTIDAVSDSLYLQIPATGVTTLIGAITLNGQPLDFSTVNGFDIPTGVNVTTSTNPVMSGSAFAALTVGGVSRLYSINLVSGAATLMGTIGNGVGVNGLAVQNDTGGFPSLALSNVSPGAANIVRFNTATPAATTTVSVTGIAANETLVGIAYRPATGQLFGLGVNATGTGTLYRIDPQSAAAPTTTAIATAIGATGSVNPVTPTMGTAGTALPNPATAGFGFAFNATVDLIRVITTAGQSFVINQATGTVLVNSPNVNGATTTVDSAAYTNDFGQPLTTPAGPTTLYTLDATSDALFIMNPGTGTTTRIAGVTLNGAPLNFSNATGFEIPAGATTLAPNGAPVAAGFGYATLTVGGATNLYRINLLTGAATNIGSVPTGSSGLTLGDTSGGVISFASATFSGNEGGVANVVLTRTGTSGPQTVTVLVAGGSATPGADFTAGPYRVTFVEGQTTATLSIPLTADMLTEGPQSIILSMSAPGAVIGVQSSATVNIVDTSLTFTPFYTGAQVVGGSLILSGSGVAGGTQAIPLPPGSLALFADVNGDNMGDVILVVGNVILVADGASGRFLALAADVNGDGVRDLQVFNTDGTTTTTDGRSGRVTRF